MGKYIRTKDRICEFEIEFSTMPNFIGVKGKGIGGLVCKEEIVRQADTIEELCDEFVIKVDNEYLHAKYYPVDRTFYIYNTEEEISLGECLRFNYAVKGAIWTEWGLKYVAKMNEKGELELL